MRTLLLSIISSFRDNWMAVLILTLFGCLSIHLIDAGESLRGSPEENAFSPFGPIDILICPALIICWSGLFSR